MKILFYKEKKKRRPLSSISTISKLSTNMSQVTRLPPLNLNSDDENGSQSSNMPSTARERRRQRILKSVVDPKGANQNEEGDYDEEEESVRDKPPMGSNSNMNKRRRRSRLASKESNSRVNEANGGYDNKAYDSTIDPKSPNDVIY